jgi:hypothetical protein
MQCECVGVADGQPVRLRFDGLFQVAHCQSPIERDREWCCFANKNAEIVYGVSAQGRGGAFPRRKDEVQLDSNDVILKAVAGVLSCFIRSSSARDSFVCWEIAA